MRADHPHFADALAALDEGDLSRLEALLDAHPALVHACSTDDGGIYSGYFWRATLLHHVAGNPARGSLPPNVTDAARLLLDRGADVEATCGGGPDQPDSAGSTVLTLVASGRQADRQGVARPLIDLFLERGARLDPTGTGGLLWTTLYHTVENQGQRDLARYLVERGHPTDLPFAAGVGDLDTVRRHLRAGAPGPHADRLYRHHRASGPEAEPAEVVQDALLFAVINGHGSVVDHLLGHGADVDHCRPWAAEVVTPLHGAAWAGWPEMVRMLLDRGAELTVRDPRHAATAVGWASHLGRSEVLAVFEEHADRLDLLDALELGLVDRVTEALGGAHPDLTVGRGGPGALLRSAARLGHREIVRVLLEAGADPTLRDPRGRSAVDAARDAGHLDLAELLLRHGAA